MNVEKLSDIELRYELLKRGFPNVPITETTRKILMKRLKNHITKNEHVSPVRDRILKTIQSNKRKSSLSPGRSTVSCTPSSKYAVTDNALGKLNTYLTRSTKDSKLKYMSINSTRYSNMDSKKVTSNIYVSPLIISDYERNHKNSYVVKNENSNVVDRLLKLRDSTIKSSTNHLYLHEMESDGDSISIHRNLSNIQKQDRFKLVPNCPSLTNAFKLSSVPYFLISLFALYLAILSLLYLMKPPDLSNTIFEESTTFTTCRDLKHLSNVEVVLPSVDCIEFDVVSSALAFNRELIQVLHNITVRHYCDDSSIRPEISGANFINCAYGNSLTDVHQMLRVFHAALYLIDKNPQWKILIINASESRTPSNFYQQDIHFKMLNPHLPVKCIIFNNLERFFRLMKTIFLVALCFLMFFGVYQFLKKRHETRSIAVEYFIKEIIKELSQRSSNKEIIITHLRDNIMTNNEKNTSLWAWNEALRKLESTDSRIQFNTTVYNGQEYRTITWVECHHNKTQEEFRCKKKQWQSPAFENANNCIEPPTSCLKIRHMFDISEINQDDLKQNIIDSLLEKVSSQCRIYDIQLDKQSCCVFIRCASEKDAGVIYNKINGWWFNNRLVSIKFLRLERYLARFPNAKTFPTLLMHAKDH